MTPGADPDSHARRLAAESLADGDATGWFERLYADAERGAAAVPWDRGTPHPLLMEWAAARSWPSSSRDPSRGPWRSGGTALVVGCGLGEDAELVARLGFDTTAFDVSAAAIRAVRRRFPDSPVRYQVADLFSPPTAWREAFDLVVESLTVQALPDPQRRNAIERIAGMVAAGGTLIVVAAAAAVGPGELAAPGEPEADETALPTGAEGPPWPLSRAEITAFASGGLQPVRVEHLQDAERPGVRHWRAEFRRPPAAGTHENPGTYGGTEPE